MESDHLRAKQCEKQEIAILFPQACQRSKAILAKGAVGSIVDKLVICSLTSARTILSSWVFLCLFVGCSLSVFYLVGNYLMQKNLMSYYKQRRSPIHYPYDDYPPCVVEIAE